MRNLSRPSRTAPRVTQSKSLARRVRIVGFLCAEFLQILSNGNLSNNKSFARLFKGGGGGGAEPRVAVRRRRNTFSFKKRRRGDKTFRGKVLSWGTLAGGSPHTRRTACDAGQIVGLLCTDFIQILSNPNFSQYKLDAQPRRGDSRIARDYASSDEGRLPHSVREMSRSDRGRRPPSAAVIFVRK